MLQESIGADQQNQRMRNVIGPLYWFPVVTDWIVGLSLGVDRSLNMDRRFNLKVLIDSQALRYSRL